MAQIVTITNPLTGQPAQVDQLEHTAQEIDDAIARALPGGAIDMTLQNKAPAGYGLGGIGKRVTDMNNAKESGFYSAIGSTNLPPNVESVQYGNVLVLCSQADRVTQVYFHDVTGGTGAIAVRRLNGNGWSQWEFINPPMKLGVEYRTTERYLGKPVYRKLIWGGPLPNSGYTGASIASGCIIIQAVCHQTSAASASEVTPSTIGDVIPWNNNEGDGINMNAFKNHVYLWCKINRSSSNFVAYLWYIKDTD